MTSTGKQSSVSVLIFGDVNGRFRTFFRTLTKINKQSGPFEAVYCVGSFFGSDNSEWELVKSCSISFPIPCYILGPCKSEHEIYFPDISGMELAPNIICLGKRGILTTSSGLKVAYLSGTESTKESKCTFTAKDIYELQQNFQTEELRGVDFLLTSQWPKDVTKGLPVPTHIQAPKCVSQLISTLAVTVKPCYHFAGLEGINFQRHPYRNPKSFSDKLSHTTKFIALGELGSKENKFVFGLSHIPLHKVTEETLKKQKQEELSTECPYQVKLEELTSEKQAFTWFDTDCGNESGKTREKLQKKGRKTMQNCWFCLRLPVEKHLLVMAGQHCYLSLAKGWLTEEHLLIISNSHCNSTANLKEDALQEIHDFKHILKKYFHSHGKNVVFYERSFKTPHLQIQVVPVPGGLGIQLENMFIEAASASGLTLNEVPPYSVMKQVMGTKTPYFFLEIECMEQRSKKFVHKIEKDFPLLFARQVLASEQVLNVPQLVDWKENVVSFIEEKNVCERFRKNFYRFQQCL